MQSRYDDPVPNSDNFTPQRPIRVPPARWDAFGALVGGRERSADLNAYIEWRLANPLAELGAPTQEQVLDFFLRIRITPGEGGPRRRAEITAIPGTKGPAADQLRAEIAQAIATYFNPPPPPPEPKKAGARRTRKAGTE